MYIQKEIDEIYDKASKVKEQQLTIADAETGKKDYELNKFYTTTLLEDDEMLKKEAVREKHREYLNSHQ